MHKVFAIEPDVLWDPEVFGFLRGKFGPRFGRLIGRLPKKWKKEVEAGRNRITPRHAAKLGKWLYEDVARAGFVSLRHDPRFQNMDLAATASLGDDCRWVDRASSVIEQLDYVIATDGLDGPKWIRVDDTDEYREHAKLEDGGCKSDSIPRTGCAYWSAMQPFVAGCERFKWIDYIFDNSQDRFIRPLEIFVQELMNISDKRFEIEIHTAKYRRIHNQRREVIRSEDFMDWCSGLEHLVSCGRVKISVWFWSKKNRKEMQKRGSPVQKMHPRYILCEAGGVRIDVGLDDDVDKRGRARTKTPCDLLSLEQTREVWRNFSLGSEEYCIDQSEDIWEILAEA